MPQGDSTAKSRPATYNAVMKTAAHLSFCRHCFAAGLLGASAAAMPLTAAIAQTPAAAAQPASAAAPSPGGTDRTIQRIRNEDAGSRIDELRVGGETQQITVQPKAPVPAYEVKPAEGARGNAPASGSNDTNGSRVWNVFKF
jgi:hypothetical protein